MDSVNLFIKENISSIGKKIYVTPNIPEKKLNNAIRAFGCEDFYKSILAIYDDTFLGSAKEGIVFTGEKIIHSKYGTFYYSKISSVKYRKDIFEDEKGKLKKEEYILIETKDGEKFKLKEGMVYLDKEKFAEFLNKIISKFTDYREENQLKQLSDMCDDVKIAYMKIIINMTFVDDEKIDNKEMAEIFLLMTRLNLSKEARFKIREYITEISKDKIEPIDKLIEIIKSNSEASHHKSIMISLVKDLCNVYSSTKGTIDEQFDFLQNNKELFEVTDEEINFAIETVKNDYKIFRDDVDDEIIKKNVKELAAKAGAAGVPIAAVYLSGSVVGLSAAGITSGLAALGLGMGMTGGIAVAGILAIMSYKGIKHLTGANELDKYKTKEMMLREIIKQTQKTISLIIDDINYLVQKVNTLIKEEKIQKEKIKKLINMVAQFQGALKNVDNKKNSYRNIVNRIKCPKILDEERLKQLTSDPTKKPLYNFIIVNYQLQKIKNGKEKEVFVLKDEVPTDILEDMGKIFEKIGYFEVSNILKSKTKGKLSDITKGVFKQKGVNNERGLSEECR